MPAAALVGQLALGIGLVFLRSLTPHLDHRAIDGVPLQPLECAAQHINEHVHQHVGLARRVRLDRAFELELTC